MRVGQRTQERGVDDTEERRGQPDAEGQRRDGRQGRSGLAAQHAETVAEILHHGLHHAASSDVVAAVTHHGRVAKAPRGGTGRGPRSQSGPLVLGRAHLQVELHLLANLVRDPIAVQECTEPRDEPIEDGHGRLRPSTRAARHR